jgi:hypothetical protein
MPNNKKVIPPASNVDFFSVVNDPPLNGKCDFTVNIPPNKLKRGAYRVCIMVAAATFQPVVMPIAQRGPQDDCIRFKVV